MCTSVFCINDHPNYKLILGINRDEFFDRPTAPMDKHGSLYFGVDEVHGGTWFGVSENDRIAFLTNYRAPKKYRSDMRSRGFLVKDFLEFTGPLTEYIERLESIGVQYNPFNLVFGSTTELFYFSNQLENSVKVSPGIHALSNAFMDTNWPKTQLAKDTFKTILEQGDLSAESLFSLLADRSRASDSELPPTGLTLEYERIVSSIFVHSEKYGTRSSTVLLISHSGHADLFERTFNKGGNIVGERVFKFEVKTQD